jgi:hypothetical protein
MQRNTKTQTPKPQKTFNEKLKAKIEAEAKKEALLIKKIEEQRIFKNTHYNINRIELITEKITNIYENIELDNKRYLKLTELRESLRQDGYFIYNKINTYWTARRWMKKEDTHEEITQKVKNRIFMIEERRGRFLRELGENKEMLSELEKAI